MFTHSISSIRALVVVVVDVVVVVVPLVVLISVGNRRAAARFATFVAPVTLTDGDMDIRPFELVVLSMLLNAAFAGATTHKTGKIPIIVVRNFILFPLLVSIYYIIEIG